MTSGKRTWSQGFADGYRSECPSGPMILIPMPSLPLLGESEYEAGFREGAEAGREVTADRNRKSRS